jgi:MOSC domain-containing protein YiiM
MAKVLSVNISEKKGTPKIPIPEGEFRENHGLMGDAHAGDGRRQVSLLAVESRRKIEKHPKLKYCVKNGDFGENITTEGINLHTLPVGTKLKIGEAILEVSKIGKECHAPCAIRERIGVCVMPNECIFVMVIKGGKVRPGDPIEIIKEGGG